MPLLILRLLTSLAFCARFEASVPLVKGPASIPALAPALPVISAAGSALIPGSQAMALPAAGAASPAALLPLARVAAIAAADPSGGAISPALGALFAGSRRSSFGDGVSAAAASGYIVNDEGVMINGRAAAYYQEIRRMVEVLQGRVDLSDTLNVMDETYSDVWGKLTAIEALAKARQIDHHNYHLEQTLMWVDGVMMSGKKQIAVHTHRVYFHPATNPLSEINEGIRRVDRYLFEAEQYFARRGKAEQHLGKLDEVALVFDTSGYDEIKAHINMRAAQMARRHRGRFSFSFLDELAAVPPNKEAVRASLNDLARKFKGARLEKIYEGVTYSRYVGILLELKAIEHYLGLGYQIVQSGRDLFDAKNEYVTELDTVVRHPRTGRLIVVEAKSARVALPNEQALRDKIVYKLKTYQKHRPLMEQSVGGPFDVVFVIDVGPNESLRTFLDAKKKELSAQYGFNVSFLFLSSTPQGSLGQDSAQSSVAPLKPGADN